MRIAIAGGGPGGLYLAALMKQLDAGHDITVWERNAPDDTFGFGVVFSDETLGAVESADTEIYARMARRFARWTDIDVDVNGHSFTVGGQGFAAMGRKDLLRATAAIRAVLMALAPIPNTPMKAIPHRHGSGGANAAAISEPSSGACSAASSRGARHAPTLGSQALMT